MSLRNQSALIFVSSLVQLVFGMATGILIAQYLGPTGKGIQVLAFFLPGFLTSLGTLSLGEASTYYLGKGTDPRRIVGNSVLHALILSLIYAAGTLLVLGPLRASVVKDVPLPYVALGLGVLPLMLLKNYADGVLTGMLRVKEFVAGNLTLHVSRGLLTLLFLVVLDMGLTGAIVAEFTAWVLTGVYTLSAMARGHGISWSVDWPLTRDQLRYGFQTHIGNIAQRLNLQVSTIILSSLLGAAAVGLFSVAVNLAQVLWYIPDSLGRILFPRVASSSREEANRLTPLVCRNTILLTALAGASLFLVGRPVIRLLYGEEFLPAVEPLYLLLPGIVALSISKVLTKYLSGIGKPFFNSTASVTSFLVNAPLLYLLVRSHGLAGAAIASSIAYGVHAIVVVFFYVRESRTPVGPTLLPSPGDFHLYADGAAQIMATLTRRSRRGADR